MPPAKATSKAGRPKVVDPRGSQIAVRVSPEERAQIEAVARRENRSLSAWLRIAAMDKIRGL